MIYYNLFLFTNPFHEYVHAISLDNFLWRNSRWTPIRYHATLYKRDRHGADRHFYAWTEALSDRVFVPAQKLSGRVWTQPKLGFALQSETLILNIGNVNSSTDFVCSFFLNKRRYGVLYNHLVAENVIRLISWSECQKFKCLPFRREGNFVVRFFLCSLACRISNVLITELEALRRWIMKLWL